MDWSIVFIIITLIFLEGILSIDNAAVLGAMVRHLPADKPIPWPGSLRFMAGWADRALGMQREAALKVGLLGAYAGRALMLVLAGFIYQNYWLRIIGAAYLVWLAVNHFGHMYHAQRAEAHGDEGMRRIKGGFWATVGAIELADLAFSIDNVIAAVALAPDRLWVVMLGVAIGIVTMRFAATIFTRMIIWEPALEHGAYLLLVAIGGELLLEELAGLHFAEWMQFVVSASILVLTILVARTALRRPVNLVAQPILAICAGAQALVSGVTSLLLAPFRRRPQATGVTGVLERDEP